MSNDNIIVLCAEVQAYLSLHGFTEDSMKWLREHVKGCKTCQKLKELIEETMGENGNDESL